MRGHGLHDALDRQLPDCRLVGLPEHRDKWPERALLRESGLGSGGRVCTPESLLARRCALLNPGSAAWARLEQLRVPS